jgi:hypothetical protein
MSNPAPVVVATPAPSSNMESVDSGDLLPISACCCAISSLYTVYPDCIGCSGKGVCCCIEGEGLQCKLPKVGVTDPRICCLLSKQNVNCVSPVTCMKGTSQSFCFDSRFALPCDDDVPCLFTLLPFCVAASFYECNVACCTKIKDLKNYKPPMRNNQA